MTPHYADDSVTLYHGDCLDVLRSLPDVSVDAVVTDPPYGIGFMGKAWDAGFIAETIERRRTYDGDPSPKAGENGGYRSAAAEAGRYDLSTNANRAFGQWCEAWAVECLRVLKPGGHLLAFGGTRTWHRLTCAVEDAGFEIRDSIAWLYGSGFPKSLDVAKAIDSTAGQEGTWRREDHAGRKGARVNPGPILGHTDHVRPDNPDGLRHVYEPAAAGAPWQGWGTALKPGHEPIVVARKPLASTVAANIQAHGTGALNVDGCRVGMSDHDRDVINGMGGFGEAGWVNTTSPAYNTSNPDNPMIRTPAKAHKQGRWPTNLVLAHAEGCRRSCVEGCPVAELDRQSGTLTSGQPGVHRKGRNDGAAYGAESRRPGTPMSGHGDSGGASRFFPTFRYQAKASRAERPYVVRREAADEGRVLPNISGKKRVCRVCGSQTITSASPLPSCGHDDWEWQPTASRERRISHPTVKPLALMRWLVRLVTPPGGLVLDQFAGSGTTVEAALMEGMRVIAIEGEAEYLPLIEYRIARARGDVPLVEDDGDEDDAEAADREAQTGWAFLSGGAKHTRQPGAGQSGLFG